MGLNQAEKNKILQDMQETLNGLHGMINNGYFENKVPRPTMENIKCKCCGSVLKDQAKAKERYRNQMDSYRKVDAKLHEMFKFAVMWDYSLDSLKEPLYSKTFELAWQQGHSAGLYEVYNCMADLADLMILTIEKEN